MPRLLTDPAIQVCPDFGSDAFAAVRNALAASLHITPDDAAGNLVASWAIQNAALRAAWALQIEDDAAIQLVRDLEAQEAANLVEAQAARDADDAQKELEKKRPKMHTFDATKSVGADILPHPSPYALERVKKFEYIELWYFCPEGCLDAALSHRTFSEDSYGISRTDSDLMVLRPVASVRASRKAIRDEDLSWDQMEVGATLLLRHMRQLSWPILATDALSIFWYKLQNHETRGRPNGQRALMEYQARVRREWHAALDRKDDGFNIGLIDSDLLAKISREMLDADYYATVLDVSFSPPLLPLRTTNPAPLPPS